MMKQQTTLVYGLYDEDSLVFIPQQRAHELAQLRQAIESAKTWGEFKESVAEGDYMRAIELIRLANEDDDFTPTTATPFDPEDIPGFADFEWPPFPAQDMLDWVPADIQRKFERPGAYIMNDVLVLSESDVVAIVAAMEAHGYQCIRDDHLVRAASGYE